MSDPALEPTGVDLQDSRRTFAVSWGDGKVSRVPYRELRLACRCAVCVDELTGRPLLDPRTIPEDIGVDQVEEVGLYGLRVHWSDRHATGIYTWERLRALGALEDA